MPLSRSAWMPLDQWLRTEATRRGGSYVALHDGEIVGYAGMWEHANGDATAEHGLTAVRREYRRRRDRDRAQAHAARLGGSDRRARARHLDAEGQRADAGAQPQARLRRPLTVDHLRGAAPVITVRAGRERRGHRHVPRGAEPRAPADADAARGRARRPAEARPLDLIAERDGVPVGAASTRSSAARRTVSTRT